MFSPPPGTYSSAQTIGLSCEVVGAVVHFTTDGSDPTEASNVYQGGIEIAQPTTLRAIAVAPGLSDSKIVTAGYSFRAAEPVPSIAAGTYENPISVALHSPSAGVAVYFTTDGSTPSTRSTLYTSPVFVSSSVTLQALATHPGWLDSVPSSANYIIDSSTVSPPLAYHVDSVTGDDAHVGTQARPLRTIAALMALSPPPGSTIWLARGSHWREELSGLAAGVNVYAYGVGERPLLDASDVAPNNLWEKTAGYNHVYQIGWQVPSGSGGDRHGAWEDGVRLLRVANPAAVEATPCAFSAPLIPTGGVDTIFVHSCDDSEVTGGSHIYELRTRRTGLSMNVAGGRVAGIHARRNVGSGGSILSHEFASDCLAEDGATHNMWVEGVAEDCIAWKAEQPPNYGGSTMFVTFPSVAGRLNGATYRRCRAIGDSSVYTLGYYFHTAGGGQTLDRMVFENCSAQGVHVAFGGADTRRAIYRNPSVSRSTTGISVGSTIESLWVLGGTFNGTGAPPLMTSAVSSGAGELTIRGARFVSTTNSSLGVVIGAGSVDVEQSTFAWVDHAGFYFQPLYQAAGTAVTFRNNIVSGANHALQVGPGVALSSENNDFFGAMDFTIGGTCFSTFAAYRSAHPDQDVKSCTTDPLFVGDLRSGDTAISTASPAYALGAGADAPGAAESSEELYQQLLDVP